MRPHIRPADIAGKLAQGFTSVWVRPFSMARLMVVPGTCKRMLSCERVGAAVATHITAWAMRSLPLPKVPKAGDLIGDPLEALHAVAQRGVLHREKQRQHRHLACDDHLYLAVELLALDFIEALPRLLQQRIHPGVLVPGGVGVALAMEEDVQ